MDYTSGKRSPLPKLAYRIREACEATGIGRSKLYELINDGTIKVSKIGGVPVIPTRELEKLIANGMK